VNNLGQCALKSISASQPVKAGGMSKAEEGKIDKKANAALNALRSRVNRGEYDADIAQRRQENSCRCCGLSIN
jgi:hypothetical protein